MLVIVEGQDSLGAENQAGCLVVLFLTQSALGYFEWILSHAKVLHPTALYLSLLYCGGNPSMVII